MKTLLIFSVLAILVASCGGCVKAIAAMATPTQWEIKIPAEYKLVDNKPKRMLVLVEQPVWTTSEANMRVYLTQAVQARLIEKVGIKADVFVPYQEIADMRDSSPDFPMMTPVQAGKTFNADIVLYIVIDNFGLYGLSDAGYYRGQLDVRSGLYDVAGGQRVWPVEDLKSSSVAFEMEKGLDQSAKRLAASTARCIVRNFYDCPKPEYKVADESIREF
jgi:hypothetical protein